MSNLDIPQVYREDQRHPYYSIQSGHRAGRITSRAQRARWFWGHFAAALRRALESKNMGVETWPHP
jgi:hypothetical protein